MEHRINAPATPDQLKHLKVGDTVLLSGTVFTARDAAHLRLMEVLDKGETLPFPLENAAIYYVGPTPTPPGEILGSAGPTTSGRMDAYTPRLLQLGQTLMIGKGARSQEVKDIAKEKGAVYLAALGGAGALIASSIQKVELVAWEELGCEAVRKLTVKDLALTVALDAQGGDIYQVGPMRYLQSIK